MGRGVRTCAAVFVGVYVCAYVSQVVPRDVDGKRSGCVSEVVGISDCGQLGREGWDVYVAGHVEEATEWGKGRGWGMGCTTDPEA